MLDITKFATVSARSLYCFLLILALCRIHAANAQILIVAHRGGLYSQYPESSMTLFNSTANAFAADTVFLEVDVRKSKDGTFYLMHDETVDRTTNGKGRMEDLSDQYLNSLCLKTKYGKITKEHIPTFQQLLMFIGKRNIKLMLDIKAPIHKQVLEQVQKLDLENRMLVLTFENQLTAQVAEYSQNVLLSALIETDEAWKSFEKIPVRTGKRIAYITSKTPLALISSLRKKKVFIMADVSEDLRNAGKPLHSGAYRAKVNDQKLDMLITDYPIEARNALGSKN